MPRLPILLVEDNPADVRLLKEALREIHDEAELYTAADGEEALNFIHRRHEHADRPSPAIILLDINLPKLNGHEVLRAIKAESNLDHIPVLMLTSSDSARDIQVAYEQRADAYLKKPSSLSEYFNVVSQVKVYWTELPPTVKSSLFWVNTPVHPRHDPHSPKRVVGVPTPLYDPPKCTLREVESSITPSLCKLIEYVGADGNAYFQFIGSEGTTWVVDRRG